VPSISELTLAELKIRYTYGYVTRFPQLINVNGEEQFLCNFVYTVPYVKDACMKFPSCTSISIQQIKVDILNDTSDLRFELPYTLNLKGSIT
jgi:hypothetical protein